jgi:hypothetical protein
MSNDFIDARLNDPKSKKAEALKWLTESGENTLGELGTTEESIDLVQAAYDAGAEEVLAIEIDQYGENENTGKLLVKLPSEKEARKRVFAWCGTQAEAQGFDAEEDTGQTYVFVMLD